MRWAAAIAAGLMAGFVLGLCTFNSGLPRNQAGRHDVLISLAVALFSAGSAARGTYRKGADFWTRLEK